MNQFFLAEIYQRNRTMMSLEKLLNLHHMLIRTVERGVPGSVVELGCYRGYTALAMSKTLEGMGEKRELHLYDSFQGLPEKTGADICPEGARMRDCDRQDNRRVGKGWFSSGPEQVREAFASQGATLPSIHPGWFEETLPAQLPQQVAFAHLDGDFYSSTLCGLTHLYPRLAPGAVVILDDYCDPTCHDRQNSLPGVKAACDAFFDDKAEEVTPLFGGFHGYQGFFQKD